MNFAKMIYKSLVKLLICLPIVVLTFVFVPFAIAWQHANEVAEDIDDWIGDQLDK